MSRLLDYQADRIELVLASHKVPARVTGGRVTPRLVRFQLTTPLGVKVKQVAALAEELALSLGTPSCRVYRHEGLMQVEVPRREGKVVHLLDLCRRLVEQGHGKGPGVRQAAIPAVTAILGMDGEGTPLLLRFPSPNVAHILIAGTTGSGKTALARTMSASLALFNSQRQLQMVIVDPKGRGLKALDGLPHLLQPVVRRVEDAVQVLARLVEEMERRDEAGRSEPRVVLVIDELADLVQVGGREVEERMRRLTQRGREAGIHVVACTQKPAAAVIGGLVKSNFPVRMVGSVASPEDAKVATGLARTGAERLMGQGDFVAVTKGKVTRIQAAYLGEAETRSLVTRIAQEPETFLQSGQEGIGSRRALGGPLGEKGESSRRQRLHQST